MNGYDCYLCHQEIPVGSRNYFDASGIPTHLVCPKDDPTGKLLSEALLQKRRKLVGERS